MGPDSTSLPKVITILSYAEASNGSQLRLCCLSPARHLGSTVVRVLGDGVAHLDFVLVHSNNSTYFIILLVHVAPFCEIIRWYYYHLIIYIYGMLTNK